MAHTTFPNRVWEKSANGWYSREPTALDRAHREYLYEKLQPKPKGKR